MELSRIKKLALNTIGSIVSEIITIICGLILPYAILSKFGSEINGLVNSITQFLGIITLLNLGVGAVVETAFYKPLAEKDNKEISKILVSAQKFFRKIAYILIIYIVVLVIVYPKIVNDSFDYFFTGTLIVGMSISTFAEYFFGMVNQILISADQKKYVFDSVKIVTLILNTIACCILIRFNCSIQMVKLTTSLIFLVRPIFLTWYVNKNYNINKKIKYKGEPIKQKWNGMAQHLAWTILISTDNIVLTLFSTLTNVSIYAVYNFVMNGVKTMVTTLTTGFRSVIGDMIARRENDKLKKFFGHVEWFVHTITVLVFGCTAILIVPFVKVYTNGITDANYIQPLFAVLITIANSGMCFRLPYNILILAAGHYKNTQKNYIISAIINIILSVALVSKFGLIGVSLGTLVAMVYQTIWMAWYDSKNIIKWPMKKFWKQVGVDIIISAVASVLTFKIPMISVNYAAWILLAIEVFIIWFIVIFIINSLFYRDELKSLNNNLRQRLGKNK